MNKILHIDCFGKLRIYIEGNHIQLHNSKAAELLAYLVSERGKPVKKTTIADALWPNSEQELAMDSLYKVLGYIRKYNNDNNDIIPILSTRRELALDISRVESDILIFDRCYKFGDIESYKRAVDIYQGAFLRDEFFEWTQITEAFYEIRYFELLGILSEYYKAIGEERKASFYKSLMI